jgi:hypothetical protein
MALQNLIPATGPDFTSGFASRGALRIAYCGARDAAPKKQKPGLR